MNASRFPRFPPFPLPVLRRALRVLLPLGVLGVVALLPTLPASLTPVLERTPGAPPLGVLLAVTGGQLALLVLLGVVAGAWAAPQLGFRSHLVRGDGRALRHDALRAIVPGLLVGALVVALDAWLAPLLGAAWQQAQAEQPRTLSSTVTGMLYGGLSEEIQMRWGLVSLLTLGGWKLLARHSPHPPASLTMAVIVLVALVFGALHLGEVAALVPLTPLIIARTVLINALAGVVYGWLFTRRSLESAMVAHACSHSAMTLFAAL